MADIAYILRKKMEAQSTNAIYGHFYTEMKQQAQIPIQPELAQISKHVDNNKHKYVNRLSELVKLKTISTMYCDDCQQDNFNCIKYVQNYLTKLGFDVKLYDIGFKDRTQDTKLKLKLPPVLLASYSKKPKAKTICVYSYLDVTDPNPTHWNTDPWKLTEIDRKLYGRGTASGKGHLLMWFHAIEAFIATSQELPVNIKFIVESMHHCKSRGLETLLETKKQEFLLNLDYLIMCNAEWIGPHRPCLVFGGVGLVSFTITIDKLPTAASSPYEDMIQIFQTIKDSDDNILIPKFNKDVTDVTPDEEELFESVDFDIQSIIDKLPDNMKSWNKLKLLMHFWRTPAIVADDLKESDNFNKDCESVSKTFTIKIVQRQFPDKISTMVHSHIKKACADLNIENKVVSTTTSLTRPWMQNYKTELYEAARRATIQIYKKDPNMIREDKDNVQINVLQKLLDKPYLKLPLVNNESNSEKDNENIALRNYFEGTKLIAAFMLQLNEMKVAETASASAKR